MNDATVACSSNTRCVGILEENCDSSSTYYLCHEDIKKELEAISCVHKKRETIGLFTSHYQDYFAKCYVIHGLVIYNIHITTVSLIVFSSEFQQGDGGITCKNISDHTIKKFHFPNDFLLDETEALETCQKYCSRKPTCWGCNLICHNGSNICYRGKWNAISECNIPERLGVEERALTSQKPGKNYIACNLP